LTLVCGCVSAPSKKTASVPPAEAVTTTGQYHRVERGQTLWRIARKYNVDIDELIQANKITDSSSLETGTMILIPSARSAAQQQDGEDFIWPMRGRVITGFGEVLEHGVNKGLRIMPQSSDDVVASRSGTVVFYDQDFLDLGKTVILAHPGNFWTVYGRNAEVFVSPGQAVQQGTRIGKTGSAGRDRNMYLYFELRKGSAAVNPRFYLP
jgi:murein DD-endopeptidase MepM/ murein hydrolase activator NlpD